MPTYAYRCKVCNHEFERFQKIKDEPLKECEKCKKEVDKIPQKNAGFILSGSGYYSSGGKY